MAVRHAHTKSANRSCSLSQWENDNVNNFRTPAGFNFNILMCAITPCNALPLFSNNNNNNNDNNNNNNIK
jgi:hypothetical protein